MKKKKEVQISTFSVENSPRLTKLLLPKINFDTFKLKTLQKKISKRSSLQERILKQDRLAYLYKNQHQQIDVIRPYRYSENAKVTVKCACQFHRYGNRKNIDCKCKKNNIQLRKSENYQQGNSRYLSIPKILSCHQKTKQNPIQKQKSKNHYQKINNNIQKVIKKVQKLKSHSVFSKFSQSKKTNDNSKEDNVMPNKQIKLPALNINLNQLTRKNIQIYKKSQKEANNLNIFTQILQLKNQLNRQELRQKKGQEILQEADYQKKQLLPINQISEKISNQNQIQSKFQSNKILLKDNPKQIQQHTSQNQIFIVNDFNQRNSENFIEFRIVINAPNPDQNKNDYFYLIQQAYLAQIQTQQLCNKNKQLKTVDDSNINQSNQRCSISVGSKHSSKKNKFSICSQYSDFQLESQNFLPINAKNIRNFQSSKHIQRRFGKKDQIFPKFSSNINLVQKKNRVQSSLKSDNLQKGTNLKKKKKNMKSQKALTPQQKYKNIKFQHFLSKQEFLNFIYQFQQKKETMQKIQTIFKHLRIDENLLDQSKMSQILKQFQIIIQKDLQVKTQFIKLISDKKLQKMMASLNQSIDESMRIIQQQDQANTRSRLKILQEQAQKEKENALEGKKYKSKYFQCEIVTLQKEYFISKYFDALVAKQNSVHASDQQTQLVLEQKQLSQFQACAINRQLIKPCIHHEQIQIQKFIQIKENVRSNSIFFTQNKNYKSYLKKKQYIQNSSIRMFDHQKQNIPQKVKQKQKSRFFNQNKQNKKNEDKKIALKELKQKRNYKKPRFSFQRHSIE